MEPRGRNRSEIAQAGNRRNQAKGVAGSCDGLPIGAHGKEGVDRSSPSEGSTDPRKSRLSRLAELARASVCGGDGAVVELQVRNGFR